MTAKIINGKSLASGLILEATKTVTSLKEKYDFTPGLAVVIVGNDPASRVYVGSKIKRTLETGMFSFHYELPEDISETNLLEKIEELNTNPAVHGILVQLPLPKHINESKVIETIAIEKDVDGFHLHNSGLLATGGDAMVPCTPLGCLMMLKETLGSLSGKKALVIGRSNIVGKPMAMLLLNEDCTVTIAHSRTKDLAREVEAADILIAAVGRPEVIKGDWIKKGAVVIDVGINRVPAPDLGEHKTRLVGDVEFSEACNYASAITPVPGGVGPMTIACLIKNTITAACRQNEVVLIV